MISTIPEISEKTSENIVGSIGSTKNFFLSIQYFFVASIEVFVHDNQTIPRAIYQETW